MTRKEPAADHENYSEAIWFVRLDHVQRQGRPELAPIDYVFRSFEIRDGLCQSGKTDQQRKKCSERFFHTFRFVQPVSRELRPLSSAPVGAISNSHFTVWRAPNLPK